MTNRQKKRKFCVLINDNTYRKVNDFVNNAEIVTGKVTPGTIVELGILQFFRELESRPFQDIVVEYLSVDRVGGGADE